MSNYQNFERNGKRFISVSKDLVTYVEELEAKLKENTSTLKLVNTGGEYESVREFLKGLDIAHKAYERKKADIVPYWPDLYNGGRPLLQKLADESAAASADESEEEGPLSLVTTGDKGKQVARLPLPQQKQIQPVQIRTPAPSTAPTPVAEVTEPLEEIKDAEDVEIIDVEREPLGGIGKRKEADYDLHPDDDRPTVRQAYEATLTVGEVSSRPTGTPGRQRVTVVIDPTAALTEDQFTQLGVELGAGQLSAEDLAAIGADSDDEPEPEPESVLSDDEETIAGESSIDRSIRRAAHKTKSIYRKLKGRKPNTREQEKLKGHEHDLRRHIRTKTESLPEQDQATARHLLYEQATKGLNKKQTKQLRDLF